MINKNELNDLENHIQSLFLKENITEDSKKKTEEEIKKKNIKNENEDIKKLKNIKNSEQLNEDTKDNLITIKNLKKKKIVKEDSKSEKSENKSFEILSIEDNNSIKEKKEKNESENSDNESDKESIKTSKNKSIGKKKTLLESMKERINEENIKKIKKISKHLNIIRKFHQIYNQLSGKNFIVETDYQLNTLKEFYRIEINLQILICLISFLSIITGIIYYEKTYTNEKEEVKVYDKIMLYYLHFQSILFFIALLFKEKINLKKKIELKKENEGETLISSKLYIKIIFYFIIFLLQPSPIFIGKTVTEGSYNSKYSINSILLIFLFIRLYFIFTPFLLINDFMDLETQFLCRKYNFQISKLFCIKCLAEYSPIKLYMLAFILILLCTGYSIRIFERPANNILDNYIDCLWYIIITMTTVGYGDITAKTVGGRIFSILSCLGGSFLTGMIIVTISNFLELETYEVKILNLLDKSYYLEEKKKLSQQIIIKYIEIIKKYYKGNNYNKIMNDYNIVENLKNDIRLLNTLENKRIYNFSDEFINVEKRIQHFIKFQASIFQKRKLVYRDIKKLENRIIKMKEEKLI